ncbi:5'-nucleotidase [Blastococcus brunescens]|uniref:5'-nucleotidase n=1 Tax=Blastococcus brunescens TaxID=1564165 RepID=A0ABZ1BBE2_9ACTN|nr:5'-nucleotidase [Blastococcus sp. BMG 8361]WRL66964.1 5'-nucleotidase [Blastococcus sp. BMG 8361]
MVADSYVYGTELSAGAPADLGLVNPGGLRADLSYAEGGEPGEITVAEANEVTPFANDLVVVTLTGEQLVQVLEQQWQPAGSSRPFLALGTSEELTWSYDPEAPVGERIIVDSIRIAGSRSTWARTTGWPPTASWPPAATTSPPSPRAPRRGRV